ncbi:hypothetical protein NPIL_79111, partial [Nephila pilipes]
GSILTSTERNASLIGNIVTKNNQSINLASKLAYRLVECFQAFDIIPIYVHSHFLTKLISDLKGEKNGKKFKKQKGKENPCN